MRILIIEDEQPAARQLTKLVLANRPNAQIVDTLDSVESAVRWFHTFPMPELIFMDIQIADGLSFDIFQQVKISAPVVFTTAFDQYAVQAFRVNAIDYLLKPIDPDELVKALDKVERRQAGPDYENLIHLFKTAAYKERFLVKTGQQLTFLAVSDIAFFRSSDGLTQAFTVQKKKYFIEHTLEELERLLDPNTFFRVSRSVTLSLNAIKVIHPYLNGRLKVDTAPDAGEDILVSRERAADFKVWLGGR